MLQLDEHGGNYHKSEATAMEGGILITKLKCIAIGGCFQSMIATKIEIPQGIKYMHKKQLQNIFFFLQLDLL